MPPEIKALMQGENAQIGTFSMNNVREITIYFPKAFKKPPKVSLTFRTPPPATNPYVVVITRAYFTIRFQQVVSVDIDYIALEI
jgi:hypothetical protein